MDTTDINIDALDASNMDFKSKALLVRRLFIRYANRLMTYYARRNPTFYLKIVRSVDLTHESASENMMAQDYEDAYRIYKDALEAIIEHLENAKNGGGNGCERTVVKF